MKTSKKLSVDSEGLRKTKKASGVRIDAQADQQARRFDAIDAKLTSAQREFVLRAGELVDVYSRLKD